MKATPLLFVFLFLVPSVYGQFRTSIYDYLKHVDEHYVIVVGKGGKSWDSIAATKLALGLLKENRVDVQVVLENTGVRNINKIIVGHPCDVDLIASLPCADWPFGDGESVVQLVGSDLVLSGKDSGGVIRAADILADYKDHADLKKYTYALITDSGLYGLKEAFEMECGDHVCDRGEKYICPLDCDLITCLNKCTDLDFPEAACVDESTSRLLPTCGEGAVDAGKGYCALNKVCCCVQEATEPKIGRQAEIKPPPVEPVVVQKDQPVVTKEWVVENRGAILVFGLLLAIVTTLVVIYRRISV